MKYAEMERLMNVNGWIEDNIALWYHPELPDYFMDGNSGTLILKKNGHWYQGDNCYGWADNQEELSQLIQDIKNEQSRR